MATDYRVLAQSYPAASTVTTIYTTPTGKQAVCSSLVICNHLNSTANYEVKVGGQSLTLNAPIPANDTVVMCLGITLTATQTVAVSSTGTVSFNLFGSQIT